MPALDSNQFLCPFCGEVIAKSAKICRFCKHSVTKDLYLASMPEARRGEIAKLLMESGSTELFPSFGNVRKKLERKGEFLRNVKQEDVEKIVSIFQKFQVDVEERNHIIPTTASSNSFSWIPVIIIFIVAGAVAGGYQYYRKHRSLSDHETVSVSTSSSVQNDSQQTPAQPKDPLLDARRREEHANIEALLISTATVMAGNSSGSAFFVSHQGHLISNAHVTTTMKEVGILTFDGKRHVGTVLKTDSFYDLSLIKIESREYPPLKIGDATKLHPGDTVWTVGAPHGLSFSVTRGVASYVGRNVGGKAFIQADVAINPGNSGGPMIDDDGEVIGINNFIIKQTQGLNFAIPVNYLYMGANPILTDIASTESDNSIMATWRSWESTNSPIQMASDNSGGTEGGGGANEHAPQINKLAEDIKDLDAKFKNTQTKNQDRASAMQHQIDAVTAKYGSSVGISEQEKIGIQMKKLKLDFVDLEISNIDDYLQYNKNVADIVQQVKQLSSTDASAVQQYDSQLDALQKARQQNEAQRATKVTEKQALQAQNF